MVRGLPFCCQIKIVYYQKLYNKIPKFLVFSEEKLLIIIEKSVLYQKI